MACQEFKSVVPLRSIVYNDELSFVLINLLDSLNQNHYTTAVYVIMKSN